MADNIIRFPGFLVPTRNGCLKDGVAHASFRAMIKFIPERDLLRTYHWHDVKRWGRANYKAFEL